MNSETMKIIVEAILDSHNIERDSDMVEFIALCIKQKKLEHIINELHQNTKEFLLVMRIGRAFAHIITYS